MTNMQWEGTNYDAWQMVPELGAQWYYQVEGRNKVGPFGSEKKAIAHLMKWIREQK